MNHKSITDPIAVQYGNQTLCFTIGSNHHLQASVWIEGFHSWMPLQLTGPGSSTPHAPRPLGNVRPVLINGALHCCYRDENNHIQDLVHAGLLWSLVAVTGPGGAKGAPPAASNPIPIQFGGYLHCFYRDFQGSIWDVFAVNGVWGVKQITGPGSDAPQAAPAAGDLYVMTAPRQIHIFYRGTDNHLWDAFGMVSFPWQASKISNDILAGDPMTVPDCPYYFSDAYTTYHSMYTAYRTTSGQIKAVLFEGDKRREDDGTTMGKYEDAVLGSGRWKPYTLTSGGQTTAPSAAGDPCISKILKRGKSEWEGHVTIQYTDQQGNLVAITIHSYWPGDGLSAGEEFVNGLVSAANLVRGGNTSAPFKGNSQMPQTQFYHTLACGPDGLFKTPALQGKPCVVPLNDSTVLTFFRDVDNDVHSLYVKFNRSSGVPAAALAVI
ncbi:hypothetical protein [Pedobacter sp. SYSU D00535]|uniref:hypothetical protein n=1 Tax=Pedobacter sp. SYSU D00535 TaxID=2810308 RepID=UPI001A96DC66|nr:hypothetical protein [Pedobacter sp. SYSU D00535]